MLQLNIEQTEALMALQRRRDLAQLAQLLAAAFPEAAGRLGARLADLVALGVQRGQAHGLRHALGLARYLACWFVLGAEFESRPGQEWARGLLQDARRSEGAKVFQLCRRAREALAGQPAPRPGTPPGLDVPAFDQALAHLDAAWRDRGVFGALQRGPRLVLGQACDIDGLALRLEPADRQRYRYEHGTWTRGRQAVPAVTLRVGRDEATGEAAADALAALPPQLWLLAPVSGAPARLRLRCQAQACCDAATHPLLSYRMAGRQQQWRGPATASPVLDAWALAPEPPPGGLLPMLAPPTPARRGQLSAGACGLRDQGLPLGEVRTELVVLGAEQHLMVWRREAGAAIDWTEARQDPPTPPRTQLRLERDGDLLEASRWQAGWADLDRQLLDGLAQLFGAWRRGNGLERCTLQASPALLAGEAGVTWGWIDAEQPLQSPPLHRLQARLAATACQLALTLGGEIELMGARARLRLHGGAAVPLQAEFEQQSADGPQLPPDAPLHVAFELPFVLAAEAQASAEATLLQAGPVSGGLVGACGLRPRLDGQGLQWFAQLSVVPVSTRLQLSSPWMGRSTVDCSLLPAMTLVDWSLG